MSPYARIAPPACYRGYESPWRLRHYQPRVGGGVPQHKRNNTALHRSAKRTLFLGDSTSRRILDSSTLAIRGGNGGIHEKQCRSSCRALHPTSLTTFIEPGRIERNVCC